MVRTSSVVILQSGVSDACSESSGQGMHLTDNTPSYLTMDQEDNTHSITGGDGGIGNDRIPSVEAQYERAAWFRTRATVERRPSAETALLPEGERLSSGSDKGHAKKRSTLLHVTGFIIVTEFCERLAYYGFAGERARTRGIQVYVLDRPWIAAFLSSIL